MRTRDVLTVVSIAALFTAVWVAVSRSSKPAPDVKKGAPPLATHVSDPTQVVSAALPSSSAIDRSQPPGREAPDDEKRVLLSARWGGGRGELGRSRPQEGNPEGPMSFARSGEDLLVLDQVNGRVVRYDEHGLPKGTFDTSLTTQDLAVAKDGTVALLDRLVERTVRLVDKDGRAIATLPLPADRVAEPGLITGVFVDGSDVYVEKEHGVLSRVGTIDGRAAEPSELTGRPSKDGTLLLMAVLAAREGRVTLNAFDRKASSLRFARSVQFARPTGEVVLLDTDLRGTIYLGVTAGTPQMIHLACLDPQDGHAIGRATLSPSSGAEESFRNFVVADDGTIIASFRTEDGIEYRSSHCP